ncbi:MAG: hypothetical protein U0Y68_09580 [Blastocatellia bacterium]
MKKTIFLTLIAVFATAMISSGCFSHRLHAAHSQKAESKSNEDTDFSAREEIRQTYKFAPNAEVEVVGVSGSVDVQTSESDTAEIYVLRLARNKDTFEKRKVVISFEDNKLHIRANRHERNFGVWDAITGEDDMRTRMTLKLPRQLASLHVGGVNGPVNLGEIEGRVEASGINGKVVVAKSVGAVEFGGINGKIEATLAKLDKDGVSIHGVNGNVDLKFLDEVNASIEMHGSNGRINADLPNLKVEEQKHGRYRATIGTGGPAIEVNGCNGNISLARAGQGQEAASPKTVEKKLEKIASKF